jgi:hypothetical protein
MIKNNLKFLKKDYRKNIKNQEKIFINIKIFKWFKNFSCQANELT